MILYSVSMKYESLDERKNNKDTLNPEKDGKTLKELISTANELFGKDCGLDGNLSVEIVGGRAGCMDILFACKQEKVSDRDCLKWIRGQFAENYSLKKIVFEKRKEISAKDFYRIIEKAEKTGYGNHSWITRELGFDYFSSYQFHVNEHLFSQENLSKEDAIKRAQEIMADDSLMEEIERIYSEENERQYYGNPVHYKITVGKAEAAKDIIELLIRALKTNERLLGTRLSYIYDIDDNCYNEDELSNLFELSHGVSAAVDMSGSDTDHGVYASAYREVVSFFEHLVKKEQLYTLCFFVEQTEKPGFTKSLVAAVQDSVHMIEIKEGKGDKTRAAEFLRMLTSKSGFDATPEEIDKVLPQKKAFSSSEIYEIYNKWFSNGLKSKKYRAYKECEKVAIKVNEKVSKPYEQLQNMVGLTEIKGLVDQIISAAKVKNARSKLGMDTHSMSQHMIFTGNPGSAKTTVARLLAEILKQEDVIETGNYVECGRADLVARYVGWTAKTVREKFREAHGGILFIDEAYSLVDDTQSFGDEAINTIVQEMENQRDKVIVIFAGYPDKMEEFLEKNEGLRSRIAFHLKFPDYNADELLRIMELMAKEKGYKLDKEIKCKCRMIFEQACGNAEFGNGRFVRNLLEQAIMRQADRIVRCSKNRQISRRALTMLKAEDFDVNAATQYKKRGKVIGFGA